MTETSDPGTPSSGTSSPGTSTSATAAPDQERLNTENLKDYTGLRRSTTDRKIAGVAGGLARHLNVDPTIVRVVLVVLALFGGAGLLLYGAAWVLVPEEGTDRSMVDTSDSTRNALLIGAGVLAALLVVGDSWGGGFPWGLAWLFLVVAVLVIAFSDRERPKAQQPPYPAYPQAYAGTTGGYYSAGTAATDAPAHDESVPPPPSWYPPASVPPPAPRPPRTRGPRLFGFTVALIALGLGLLGLFEAAGGEVPGAAYPALALALTGLMLVVGSFFGRPGGLIALGLLALVNTVAVGVGDPDFGGDRDQRELPVSASSVQDEYRVPAGRIELDLRDVRDPEELDGRTIALAANVGELVVIVPEDVTADVVADIDMGGVIDVPGYSREGWDVSLRNTFDAYGDPVATVELRLELRAGHIEVRQG